MFPCAARQNVFIFCMYLISLPCLFNYPLPLEPRKKAPKSSANDGWSPVWPQGSIKSLPVAKRATHAHTVKKVCAPNWHVRFFTFLQ